MRQLQAGKHAHAYLGMNGWLHLPNYQSWLAPCDAMEPNCVADWTTSEALKMCCLNESVELLKTHDWEVSCGGSRPFGRYGHEINPNKVYWIDVLEMRDPSPARGGGRYTSVAVALKRQAVRGWKQIEPAPVLQGVPYFRKTAGKVQAAVDVWCVYCQVWHAHSYGNGQRVAHCDSESGYKKHGYLVEIWPPMAIRKPQVSAEVVP